MAKITITISNEEGDSVVLKAPPDIPLSMLTSSVQCALVDCSAFTKRQRAWSQNVWENVVPNWDLDSLGHWGAVEGSVIFFPTTAVDAHALNSVKEVIEDERAEVEIGSFKFCCWSDMCNFVKALSLAALIACHERTMLIVRSTSNFEIGDGKYCPVPGVARALWEKMKEFTK